MARMRCAEGMSGFGLGLVEWEVDAGVRESEGEGSGSGSESRMGMIWNRCLSLLETISRSSGNVT